MQDFWTEKFFPKGAEEFIGNTEIVEKSFEWAKKWAKGSGQPPLLFWGQSGAGKTCLAYLLARQFNWGIVELNGSMLRSKEVIEKVAGAALQSASITGSKRLLLLDEVDALTRNDRGGAKAILSVIKEAKNPVVITANDIFSNRDISQLRFVCRAFEFKKINYLSIAKRLREILELEKIPFDENAVKELAQNSSGDMRSALLDLQTLSLSKNISMQDVASLSQRERQQKVFSVMKAIFKGTDFAQVREARSQSDLSNDMLFNWVEENIPRQYSNVNDVALAFDRLSRADVFNGRIFNKQHWGFLRYSTELAAEGVALSKSSVSNDFVMYQFPGLLSMLSRTSSLRALKRELGSKIGAKTHSSSREVVSNDLPFFKMVFADKKKAVGCTALFGLTEKEVAFLLDTKPETKKVQSIMEESQKIIDERARPKRFFYGPVQEEDLQGPLHEEPGGGPESLEAGDTDLREDEKGKQTRLF
ncbi:MAG: replication factor C large subunit [archaeon]